MNARRLLYVFTQAPYSSAAGQEALDAAIVGATFEQEISLLFLHNGVFQLKQGQDASGSELKQYTKAYAALSDFGIENVYVHDLSLLARGLEYDSLMLEASLVDGEGVRALIKQQHRVFTF